MGNSPISFSGYQGKSYQSVKIWPNTMGAVLYGFIAKLKCTITTIL